MMKQNVENIDAVRNPQDKMSIMKHFHREIQQLFVFTRPLKPISTINEDHFDSLLDAVIMPYRFERLMLYGVIVCLDTFLHSLFVVPLRALISLHLILFQLPIAFINKHKSNTITLISTCGYNLMMGIFMTICCYVLWRIDARMLLDTYLTTHSLVALYTWTGMLEILDRVLTSFGRLLFNAVDNTYWLMINSIQKTDTTSSSSSSSYTIKQILLLLLFSIIFSLYTIIHSFVYIFHIICIIRAFDKQSIFMILLINNFAEINACLFKKYTPDSLKDSIYLDFIERFKQLFNMICIVLLITLRKIEENNNSTKILLSSAESNNNNNNNVTTNTIISLIPEDIIINNTNQCILSTFQTAFYDTMIAYSYIWMVEIFTDNLKHAFIFKYSCMKSIVYNNIFDHLCLVITTTAENTDEKIRLMQEKNINVLPTPQPQSLLSDTNKENPTLSTIKNEFTQIDISTATAGNMTQYYDVITKEVGFATLPLCCVMMTFTLQLFTVSKCVEQFMNLSFIQISIFIMITIGILLIFKIIIGMIVRYISAE